MNYEKVKMLGMHKGLQEINLLIKELQEILYHIGYGISDMDYMGWTDDMPETKNMILLYEDLKATVEHLKTIVSQGVGETSH